MAADIYFFLLYKDYKIKMTESWDKLYNRYISMSSLLTQYLQPSDKYTAKKWIIFASKLPRESGTNPGETRYKFAKHLFQVIKHEVYATTLSSENGKNMSNGEKQILWEELKHLGKTDDFVLRSFNKTNENKVGDYMNMWSPDKRTYISAKPIPGKGALIYLAVAENPELGWDLPNPTG